LSHTNTWKAEDKTKRAEDSSDKSAKSGSKTGKPMNKSTEKSSLGELDAFSDLKAMFDNAGSKPATETKPKAEKKVAEVEEKETAKGDDLKKITGVGPAFEKRLNALGINTYADLIALTDEKIAELESQDSMTSLEQWHVWIEEAKTF
jgi:large subunit ribosomal protein L21